MANRFESAQLTLGKRHASSASGTSRKSSELPKHGSYGTDSGPFDAISLLLIPQQTWMSVACQERS